MILIRLFCGIILLFAQTLFAAYPLFKQPDEGLLTSFEGVSSGLIDGHVNVISGAFVDSEVDMIVPGPEPLRIARAWTQPASYEYRQNAAEMEVYWLYENESKVQFYSENKATYGKDAFVAELNDPFTQKLYFLFQKADLKKRNYAKMWEKMLSHGVTNTSGGTISAQSNIRNSECSWSSKEKACDIQLPDGTHMLFANLYANTFYLTKTVKPNFMQICKDVKKGIWNTVLKNANGLTLSSYDYVQIGNETVHITASDGRVVKYEGKKLRLDNRERNKDNAPDEYHADFQERYQISRVKRPNAPEINYEYYEPRYHKNKKHISKSVIVWPKVAKKSYPDSRSIEINYYTKDDVEITSSKFWKVKELKAPIGSGPEMLAKYRFRYSHVGSDGGVTGVINAKGILTNYVFNNRYRLTTIVKCQENEVPYTIEELFWGPKGTPHEIELQSRTFGSAHSSNKIFCKRHIYDDKGNIAEDQLWGNLTGTRGDSFVVQAGGLPAGGDCDVYVKRQSYSGSPFHLLTQTIEGRVRTDHVYVNGTNLLYATFKSDENGIFERHFYHNDNNGLVVCHVIDDGKTREISDLSGVTVRKIERTARSNTFPHGLPLVVSEYYLDPQDGQEKLLSEKRNTFDKLGRMTVQETYDCNRQFFARESWEYDNHGNCLVHTNPMGDQIRSTYDANDNKITEQGPNPDLYKRFFYDYMNRLIKVEEQHPDVLLSKHFKYDLCGNQIASIDVFGQETNFEFDAFNRPITVVAPPVQNAEGNWIRPVTRYGLNEMGHTTSVTDPEGNVTQYRHTLYGKPYYILYPDGSEERFEYDLQGNLTKEIAKNGTVTLYTLDSQARIAKKQMLSRAGEPLWENRATYDSFHLMEEVDAQGNITSYTYDAAGRLSSVIKGEHKTYYEYDSMSRLLKTIEGNSVQISILDCQNKKIESRVELRDGTILTATKFGYDSEGHQILVQVETPQGSALTLTVYDTHGVPIKQIDPLGYTTTCRQRFDYTVEGGYKALCLETVDPIGQRTMGVQDALGRAVFEQKFDSFGTLLQEVKHYYNALDKRVKTVHKVLLDGIEQRQIINCFQHDSMGRLTLLIQAAGSSEELRFTTKYNAYGEKEFYIKPNGTIISYLYDELGRLSRYYSSDHSIDYAYTYDLLSQPIFVEDKIQGRSTSRSYDRYGNIIEEKLAHGLILKSSYNEEGLLERVELPDASNVCYSYEGPRLKVVTRFDGEGVKRYTHTYIKYDSAGRLEQSSMICDDGQLDYQYNLGNAITSIRSLQYQQSNHYDAVGNLVELEKDERSRTYEYDALNQLKKEEGPFSHVYSHDSLYNRASKDGKAHVINALNQILHDGDSAYTYDLSGNLIKKEGSDSTTEFKYDALDRLITLKVDGSITTFSYDENNRCLCLGEERIIYVGQYDIGTIAKTGDVLNLRVLGTGLGAEIGAAIAVEVSGEAYAPIHDHNGNVVRLLKQDGSVYEQYDYNAFGEEKGSKESINPWRYASKRNVSGYLMFGRRFYNPELGRWLTADPTGYEAGPNLYAYLFNNPLTHFDSYGLFDEETSRPSWYSSWDETVSTIGDGLKYAFQTNAQMIQQCIWHLDPMPIRKDVGLAIGYLAEHGTLSGYTMSWNRDQVDEFVENDRPLFLGKYYLHITNGMNNTFDDGIAQAYMASDIFDGCAFTLLHVPGRGTVSNLIDTIMDKCNILSETSRKASASLRGSIDNATAINLNAKVLSISFSQGGEVIFHGLEGLSAAERAEIHSRTLGSARFIRDMGQASYENKASTRDWVPAISNPNYALARMGWVGGISFLPCAGNPFFDHTMSSPTYIEALHEIKRQLN